MAVEIERKYLVDRDKLQGCTYFAAASGTSNFILQGYLLNLAGYTLRVRVSSKDGAVFTYKGPTKGISRTEIEFSIPKIIGNALLCLCGKVLRKTRIKVPTLENNLGLNNLVWEVDEFHNLGYNLTIAEIELPSEDATFTKPDWIGTEVSGNPSYYNSNLIERVRR